MAEVNASVVFHRNGAGEVDRITVVYEGQKNEAKRVDKMEGMGEQLAEFEGRYYSPELGTFYVVKLKDDKLVALHRRHGEIELTPTTQHEFAGSTWYFGRAQFERDEQGTVTTMLVSSGRVSNVRFELRPE